MNTTPAAKKVAFAWLVLLAMAWEARGEVRVENGALVADSPFDFRIGSTDYAAFAPTNAESSTMYSASVRLTKPYFGVSELWIGFSGRELERVDISSWQATDATREACMKRMRDMSDDIRSRIGVELKPSRWGSRSEAAVSNYLAQAAEDSRKAGVTARDFSVGFWSLAGEQKEGTNSVSYRIDGMARDDGAYEVRFEVSGIRASRTASDPGFGPGTVRTKPAATSKRHARLVAGALIVLFAILSPLLIRTFRSEFGAELKTPFDKVRMWRRFQLFSAIMLMVVSVIGSIEFALDVKLRSMSLFISALSLVACVSGWLSCRSARCPHCGKCVMSGWSGRDGAGQTAVRRIMRREPVVCVHCGAQIETE